MANLTSPPTAPILREVEQKTLNDSTLYSTWRIGAQIQIMAKSLKINVPVVESVVENTVVESIVESTTPEENTTMQTENIPVLSDVLDRMEKAIDQAMTPTPMPKLPVVESTPVVDVMISLAELVAYTPDAINAAISEVESNHATVNVLIGKLPDAVIVQTRAALGITDNKQNDVDAIKTRLGGKVATVIDAIKRDEKWEVVTEYNAMLDLINAVNVARSALGLSMLTVKVGARTKGAAISQDASVHTRNMTGFMRPGIYAWNSIDNAKVDWIVTNEKIVVNVNGVQTYAGAQGEISLSKIHNDYVIKVLSDSGSRESFPAFLAKMGYPDASVIMLHAKPSFPVEA